MTADVKYVLRIFFFFIICGVVTALAALVPFFDVHNQPYRGSEYMAMEIVQEFILLLVIIINIFRAIDNPEARPGLLLVVGFFACLLIRELDFAFDRIRHGVWFYCVLAVFIVCVGQALKTPSRSVSAIAAYCREPGFFLIFSGLLVLFSFSRIFGMQVLWRGLMQEDFVRIVKDMVEEGVELLGYTLILLGTLTPRALMVGGRADDKK